MDTGVRTITAADLADGAADTPVLGDDAVLREPVLIVDLDGADESVAAAAAARVPALDRLVVGRASGPVPPVLAPLTTALDLTYAAGPDPADRAVVATATARTEAIRKAKRILDLDAELEQNMARIRELVQASPAADLLHKTGIGPVTAARTLVVWSHPGRINCEAAFAAIAGVNPIPASSGNTIRHRLNRGGDRQLNRALNVIAMVRMVHDPNTRAYVSRRRAEGKTDREIRRILKRYLARSIYRHLNAASNIQIRG